MIELFRFLISMVLAFVIVFCIFWGAFFLVFWGYQVLRAIVQIL